MSSERAILTSWGIWLASWIVAALWSDRAAMRPKFGEEVRYRVVTLVGMLLLFIGFGLSFHAQLQLWELDQVAKWVLAAVAVVGFAFAWWARLYLGRLWSSSVTRKAGHHVVDTGPYA